MRWSRVVLVKVRTAQVGGEVVRSVFGCDIQLMDVVALGCARKRYFGDFLCLAELECSLTAERCSKAYVNLVVSVGCQRERLLWVMNRGVGRGVIHAERKSWPRQGDALARRGTYTALRPSHDDQKEGNGNRKRPRIVLMGSSIFQALAFSWPVSWILWCNVWRCFERSFGWALRRPARHEKMRP